MVQLTFGDTNLVFPDSPTIGDVILAYNNIPYEYMSDGRWKNVVNYDTLGKDSSQPGGKSSWIPSTDNSGESLIIPVPASGNAVTTSQYLKLDQDPTVAFDAVANGVRTSDMNAWFMPNYNKIYVSHVQSIQRGYRGGSDITGLPLYTLLLPDHRPSNTDEFIWLSGAALSAISDVHHLYVVINLSDYVSNMSYIEDVSWKLTYQHGNALGSSAQVNSWSFGVYDQSDPNKHYYGSSIPRIDSISGDANWGGTNVDSDFVDRGMTSFRQFGAGAKYLWIDLQHMTNNVIRDLKLELFDTRDPGDPSTRQMSGMYITADGNKIYTSDKLAPGSIREFNMTDFDPETAVVNQTQNSFDDDSRPAIETTEPLGIWMRSDGNNLYLADEKGKIKQYRCNTPFDILTLDDVYTSNEWYWDDYYEEFSTIAFPIDIHMSEIGDRVYVLEADNIIREYSLSTDWDISTAVYSGFSLDCTSKTPSTSCFTISRDGKILILAYADGMSQAILPTAFSLDGVSWDDGYSVISADDPKGIVFNDDNTKLFVADIPDDLTTFMRIGVYEQSG